MQARTRLHYPCMRKLLVPADFRNPHFHVFPRATQCHRIECYIAGFIPDKQTFQDAVEFLHRLDSVNMSAGLNQPGELQCKIPEVCADVDTFVSFANVSFEEINIIVFFAYGPHPVQYLECAGQEDKKSFLTQDRQQYLLYLHINSSHMSGMK